MVEDRELVEAVVLDVLDGMKLQSRIWTVQFICIMSVMIMYMRAHFRARLYLSF